MGDSDLSALSETALPTVGPTNKVWCSDIESLRSYPNLNKIGSVKHRNGLLEKITTSSKTNTNNFSTQLQESYNNQFTSLIKEKQNSSIITTLLTTTVTKDIYLKINDTLRTIYNAENIVYTAFQTTEYGKSTTSDDLATSLKDEYKGFFSNNEVLNVFELQTPYATNSWPGEEETITTEVTYPSMIDHGSSGESIDRKSQQLREGIDNRKILFSSYGLNESLIFTSDFNNKTFYDLATDKVKLEKKVENKPIYEYARDFGLEAIIHSKMLSSFKKNNINIGDRKISSGFIVTRDKYETITGLIFYATLIIPRPFLKMEVNTIQQNQSDYTQDEIDNANSASTYMLSGNYSNSSNERKQYIAISSRFNFFDLIEYYPIRQSITDSNLITILANTFNHINEVKEFTFLNTDNTWQLGLKTDYAKLKCLSSTRNPTWTGKLINECKLPEHTNVDYPAYIFRIISSINRQFEIDTLVNGQKIVSVEELGDDKYIVIINITVKEITSGDNSIRREYSFLTKEIQYNNLFPATILNSDVEINGELIVRNNTTNLELMKIDPIKNTTNFFTKVGINQPSYEINSYLDINNLSRPKVTLFINEFTQVIKRNTSYANNINTSNVSSDMVGKLIDVNTNDIVITIPLKQYKSVVTTPIPLDRASRMNIFTAKIEGAFVILQMERVQTQIAKNRGKISANNENYKYLVSEKAYYARIEFIIKIAMVLVDVVAGLFSGGVGGGIVADAVYTGVKASIQSIDWAAIAKDQSQLVQDEADKLDLDSDDYDTGSEICQALMDVVQENTKKIYEEIVTLETEYNTLKERLADFEDVKNKANTIVQNHNESTSISSELLSLKQDDTILRYILENKHTVITNVVISGNLVSSITVNVTGIIMGTNPLLNTITNEETNTYTNLLTDTTSIETFKIQYIDNMPDNIDIVTVNGLIEQGVNYDKTALSTMYEYANGTKVNNIDDTVLSVDDVNNTKVLTYINEIYLPWISTRSNNLVEQQQNLHNKNTQFAFKNEIVPQLVIQTAEREIEEDNTTIATNTPEYEFWSLLRNGALGIINSSMGDHHTFVGQLGYFGPELTTAEGKYSTRYKDVLFSLKIAYPILMLTSARKVARDIMFAYSDILSLTTLTSLKTSIENAEKRLIKNTNFLNTNNIDELQKLTKDFGFDGESHNKIRNYLNHIWQIYESASYKSIAKVEKYTIYANLTDVDESNMYAININILHKDDEANPDALMTCSYLNTDNYINDLSYRSKFIDIANEINSTSELVNYASVIFKTYINDIITGTKTIAGIISSDILFPDRFNGNSYITIDNITDSKVVCDELNPSWNNQSFDSIIISGTTTLGNIYTTMYDSYEKNYKGNEDIIYDFNYLVEYIVNGIAKLSIIRYIKVSKYPDPSGNLFSINNATTGTYKTYRITSTIDIESLIVKGMTINGDASIDGNFYVNIDNDTRDPMFTIDVYNKTNTSKLKLGLGKDPTTVLDITDTTISKMVAMDSNMSTSLYIINEVLEFGRYRSIRRMKSKLTEFMSNNPNNKNYIDIHRLPATKPFQATDLTILYYSRDLSWNSYTYSQIMTTYPAMKTHIETIILPPLQKVLDEYLLYNMSICTTSTNFTDGVALDYYRILEKTVGDGASISPLMLSTGSKLADYNIDPTYTSSMNNIIEYTQKQTRFMNYIKKINNTKNILKDISGSEVNVYNQDSNKKIVDAITTPSILNNINVYVIGDNNNPSLSKVDSITSIRTELSNNNVNVNVDYSRSVPNTITTSDITTQISSLTYATTDREHATGFVLELLKQYDNDIMGTKSKNDDAGMIVYKVGTTYYRSMYYLLKKADGTTFVYSFYMNYNDYISNLVNINGDTRMEGKLSLINEFTNTSHVVINPLNNYFGVNSVETTINYADKYETNSSIYNASHNLVVYNDKYPNAVFARTAETTVINNTDYKYFGSHSGLTVQRASGLYVFDHDSSFMNNVRSNNRLNYSITDGIMTNSNWNNYKHYGPDISFELRNKNGVTKELGQVKMVIDKIDENNNIHTGFGVQVVDNTVVSDVIEDKIKNLMYVNSDRQLFVDGVVLGGKILKVDDNGNLKWGDTVIVPAPTP
jgi:hypothetical protein